LFKRRQFRIEPVPIPISKNLVPIVCLDISDAKYLEDGTIIPVFRGDLMNSQVT